MHVEATPCFTKHEIKKMNFAQSMNTNILHDIYVVSHEFSYANWRFRGTKRFYKSDKLVINIKGEATGKQTR